MTQAELDFYNKVPTLLRALVEQVTEMNERLDKVVVELDNIKKELKLID